MHVEYEYWKKKKIKGVKLLKFYLKYKRSRLRDALIELSYKGLNEREFCEKLGLVYKNYRYYVDKYDKELKEELNQARSLGKRYRDNEKIIRKETRNIL